MHKGLFLLRTSVNRFIIIVLVVLLTCSNVGTARAEVSLIDQLQEVNQQNVVLIRHDETGVVSSLRVPNSTLEVPHLRRLSSSDAGIVAQSFIRTYGSIFGLDNRTDSIGETQREITPSGATYIKYQQQYKGIPVVAGEMVVGLSAQRSIRSVHAEILPMTNERIDTTPVISSQEAQRNAKQLLQRNFGGSSRRCL